ncbi:hypothetical protein MHBO_002536 [Bonamia ostreae]|uniref:Glycosyl transferase family 25 domain-containing protein n=1 Tax=Bonamia ostreae TaxID=126728 RepID=A0ABV2AMQ9_9EUKA
MVLICFLIVQLSKGDFLNTNIVRINDFFDKVYVINLERRTDRLSTINASLRRLNVSFETIKAIDGNSKDLIKQFKQLKKEGKIFSEPGSLGLSLTMLKTIRLAKEKNHRKILWLEDDATFKLDFNFEFDKVIKRIPSNWTVLYLGCTLKNTRGCF